MHSFVAWVALSFSSVALYAETAQERLKESTEILTEIMGTPDKGIPQDLLEKAHCLCIVPGLKQAAFGVGGKYGRVGFQIGASSTDIVMLVMNERGMKRLLEDKFTLGANASVAAGPVGRSATAQTDAQLSAEILSWSRSKGLFAGVALEGATLRNDLDENLELYGSKIPNKDILLTPRKVPPAAQPLVAALNRYSRYEAKDKPIESRAADAVRHGADREKAKRINNRESVRAGCNCSAALYSGLFPDRSPSTEFCRLRTHALRSAAGGGPTVWLIVPLPL
jgi:lipid-binding SYLF domain-containing protein